jgi:hypothetical protein
LIDTAPDRDAAADVAIEGSRQIGMLSAGAIS